MRNRLLALALPIALPIAAAAALTGCVSAPVSDAPAPRAMTEDALRGLPIYNANTGDRVDWATVVAQLNQADAVLMGEMHGHPVGLPAAALLFADMAQARPEGGALALEFLERDVQHHLDDYLTGVTDRDAFAQAADLSASSYPPGHESMVETAKASAWPVSAANAPRRYVRLSRTEGYDRLRALTPDQRALFVLPDRLNDGAYRDRFFELMGAMRTQPAAGKEPTPEDESAAQANAVVESFFRAQQVWDHTMADSVAQLARAGRAPVVLVIGRFHTDFEGGTVTALQDLIPGKRIATLSFADRDLGLLGLHEEDRGIADFVIYTGPMPQRGR